MGFSDWIGRIFRGTSDDDESAEHEEYGGPDPGEQALAEPAPSLFGGVPPLTEGEFEDHGHDPNP